MSSRQSVVVALVVALSTGVVENGAGQVTDPCNMSATSAAGVLFACPQGDGDRLDANGLTVTVTVRDNVNAPVPGILPEDIWLIGCNNLLALCGGSAAINASGPTDANGQTTIIEQFAVGGCDLDGVRAVVMGIAVGAGVCADPCLPIKVKSADLSNNLVVNLVDFAMFGADYPSPPKPYNECLDYVAPFGTVTLADYAKYGVHSGHTC